MPSTTQVTSGSAQTGDAQGYSGKKFTSSSLAGALGNYPRPRSQIVHGDARQRYSSLPLTSTHAQPPQINSVNTVSPSPVRSLL